MKPVRISLVQYLSPSGTRGVAACIDDRMPIKVAGCHTTLELAQQALQQHTTMAELILKQAPQEPVPLQTVQWLAPIDHPDPAHLWLTGTGLTHLGSADARDQMHRKLMSEEQQTDSLKMFRMGLQGGKPSGAGPGVQPEWFFKGNGHSLVGPGQPLATPDFAQDAGEEPEIAGVYLIDAQGRPVRLGYALANEFSDHVTERTNYLWLAHSKLRPAALGPELLLGNLPARVHGTSRIIRNAQVIWEKPFLSGEEHMSHSLANLEHHHFKYALFRKPGDLHVHFFGTATLSCSDQVHTEPGDDFEIRADAFRLPLRNTITWVATSPVTVQGL